MQDEREPSPPPKPGDSECCGSGCDPCIWDLYREELERYTLELEHWRRLHPATPGRDE
jgi:hypothetical protein